MAEVSGESVNAEAGPPGKPERGKAVKLVDRVFDQLLERIRGGNYPPDSKEPVLANYRDCRSPQTSRRTENAVHRRP
ncbi:hypothetical protein ACC719_34610, partial [Rhizobium ruizarguesonis]